MKPTSSLSIGSPYGYACDEYDSRPARDQHKAQEVLTFSRPNPRPWVQRSAFIVNRVINLALGAFGMGRVKPVIPAQQIRKLRAIPAAAGNILVGPHPSTHDPFLMYHLYSVARRTPSGLLMASESFYRHGPLGRIFLRWLGAIPVARGRKNPQAIDYMTDRLAEGKWCGLFPEGEMCYSREVMPMEYGALRIAVEAALKVREQAKRERISRDHMTPVLITPFAHVYFFTNRKKTLLKTEKALEELEVRPEVFGRRQFGDLVHRLRAVADRLLEYKAKQYGVPKAIWDDPDRFERAKKLQKFVLENLEKKYRGHVYEGYERRRALKVRMDIFEMLRSKNLDDEQIESLEFDIQKTRDIVMTVPFSRDYLNRYGDLEMWVEYLRRFRSTLGMPESDLGPREVVFRIMPSIDVLEIAERYLELAAPEAQVEYLFDKTEELRSIIREGVEMISREHSTSERLAPWNSD